MDKYIYDESNGLWYELQGDYYIPCLTLPAEKENKPISLWGQRHYNVTYRILKLWQSKIKTLSATITIRCVLFHNDFGNSLCYNEFNLRYRTASTNLEFD